MLGLASTAGAIEHQPTMQAPLNSFTCFPKLPLELRFKIWQAMTPGPRIIEVKWDKKKDQYYTACSVPVVLHICKESRREGLTSLEVLNLWNSSQEKDPEENRPWMKHLFMLELNGETMRPKNPKVPDLNVYIDYSQDTLYIPTFGYKHRSTEFASRLVDRFMGRLEKSDHLYMCKLQSLALDEKVINCCDVSSFIYFLDRTIRELCIVFTDPVNYGEIPDNQNEEKRRAQIEGAQGHPAIFEKSLSLMRVPGRMSLSHGSEKSDLGNNDEVNLGDDGIPSSFDLDMHEETSRLGENLKKWIAAGSGGVGAKMLTNLQVVPAEIRREWKVL